MVCTAAGLCAVPYDAVAARGNDVVDSATTYDVDAVDGSVDLVDAVDVDVAVDLVDAADAAGVDLVDAVDVDVYLADAVDDAVDVGPKKVDTIDTVDDGSETVGDIGTGDTGPSVTDIAADVSLPSDLDACTPTCNGKVCGPNGCGSVCGFCKSGEFCAPDGSKCQQVCPKDCTDKICGPDGCGGQCGSCDAGNTCSPNGKCYADTCQGSCTGKQCGDNGCGKSCGDCASGDWCDAGTCKATPCKGLDLQKGQCSGAVLLTCQGSGATAQKITNDCAAPPNLDNLTCGWDAAKNAFGCITKTCDSSCVSSSGKKVVCGNNSCGKPCGTCPEGWKCDVTSCTPVAGASCTATTFPPQGQCNGDTWISCSAGQLTFVKCLEVGAVMCGWDGGLQKFACIY